MHTHETHKKSQRIIETHMKINKISLKHEHFHTFRNEMFNKKRM